MPINLPNCVAEEIHSALTHDADHGDLPSTTTYQILQTCLVKNLRLMTVLNDSIRLYAPHSHFLRNAF